MVPLNIASTAFKYANIIPSQSANLRQPPLGGMPCPLLVLQMFGFLSASPTRGQQDFTIKLNGHNHGHIENP